jgi:acylphosphatase
MLIHAEIIISGMVQGVGYRYFALRKANQYGMKGYVKNLSDGNVLCVAEGEEGLVKDFIQELRTGPMFCQVNSVKVDTAPNLTGYKSFEVRF